MLTIFILLAGSTSILVVLLLLMVVIGIRQEPPTEVLSEQAPTLLAVFVRRLLGVYVHRPDSPPKVEQGGKDHASLLAGSMDRPDLE